MKDVDPLAFSLSRVFSVSSSVEMKRNVAIGHQPGNGSRVGHKVATQETAAIAITRT
jgi:hypothetical protein